MMNITIITILLPYPLDSGGAQAQYNMIEYLRYKHNITLIYPENQHNNKKTRKELQKRWHNVNLYAYPFTSQIQQPPFFFSKVRRALELFFIPNSNRFQINRTLQPYGYDLSDNFIRFIYNVIEETKADLIQVEFYPYLPLGKLLPQNIKKIFVHHEIRYIRNQRTLERLNTTAKDIKNMGRLKEEEIADLNTFDQIITLTDVDKNTLEKDGVTSSISVSPAGINTTEQIYKEWNKTIVFIGSTSHAPNVEGITWLMNKVLPLVKWDKWSPITLKIIGKGWDTIKLPEIANLHIETPGFVESLSETIAGGIMVIPILSGSGMRMKILEGAALSLPILTTSVGVEGIELNDKEGCLIKDDPKSFAKGLEELFQNRHMRKSIATQANNIFHQKYSINALTQIRNNIYTNLMK